MGLNIKFYDDKQKEGEIVSVGYLPVDTKARKDSKRLASSGAVKEVEEKVDAAAADLQEQIDEIAEKAGSGYIPKGEVTVATLNALTGQENGELYTMTDSGTLTLGSLAVVAGDTVAWDATNEVWYKAMDYAPRQYGTNEVHNLPTTITAFRTGDVIAVDGPSGTAKMSKDELLKKTAENALQSIHSISQTATDDDLVSGNYLAIDGSAGTKKLPANAVAKRSVQDKLLSDLALDFDPTRTVSNPYKRYDVVRHDNYLYMFKTEHYGDWDASKVEVARLSTLFTDLLYADPKSLYNAWNPDITDLNNVKKTCVLNVWPGGSLNLANMPSDYGAGSGLIFTFKFGYGAGAPAIYQIIRKHTTGDIWQRLFTNGSWSAWASIKTPQINEYLHCIERALYNTWNTDITDFNSAPDNSSLVYYPYSGDSLVVANVPSDYGYGSGILTTETASYGIGATLKMQILTKFSTQERWARQYANSTWGAWTKHEFVKKNIVEIGAGKQYTTLRAGFAAALALNNAEVIVYPGTYDLVQECSDILANTLTVSYSPCVVGHGMHVKFMAGAKAVANIVKGDMSDAQFDSIRTYFEPFGFRTNGGDFTLENVVIEATDTRYCVHDDPGGQDVTYTHKYINCKMTYHSSNVETEHIFRSCIGGGLGKHGTILVDGGVYKSDVATGISYVENGDPDYAQVAIFYHNGNIADAESSVTITNVFFEDKGYVVAQSYGPSTKMTKFVVSNSHFGLPIRETYSVSPNVDVEAQWNNDIATPGHWVVASGSTTFVAD